ncbi:MAG: hypothetical protein WBN39_01350, partial [Flavobacteriaceae bacterium]
MERTVTSIRFFLLSLALSLSCLSPSRAYAQEKGALMGISITNVYDAFGKERKGLQQDFGFSCIVDYNGTIVLFDSGTDAKVFEQNVKSLKIN